MNRTQRLKNSFGALFALTFLFIAQPGFATELDAKRWNEVSATVKQAVDQGKLAGIVTLAAQEGEIKLFEAYGHRDLENEKPMEKDSIFRIFSMTKPIAGTALMILWDEGKFKLDDPV